MSEWLPIESAPKDGTPVLAYGAIEWHQGVMPEFTSDPVFAVAQWVPNNEWSEPGDRDYCPGGGHWELVHVNMYEDWMQPVAWMPLPPPPHPKGEPG